jgi:hypothetical protein
MQQAVAAFLVPASEQAGWVYERVGLQAYAALPELS